ncbi:MAG: rhomboid family intramembrane serine protease [Acidobacteriota bacterium]
MTEEKTIAGKRENLHSIYVLLFLNIAFFFLEYKDAPRYAALFSFDAAAVRAGQVWRLVTYQFTQAGQGWFPFWRPLVLFLSLFLLYLLGSAIEEVWGTRRFLTLFAVSTAATAAAGWVLGVRLLGSYFISFSLLFVFAALFRDPAVYLFGTIPIRIRWLAAITCGLLIFAAFFGGPSNIAALVGAVASYGYYLAARDRPLPEPRARLSEVDATAIRNASRYVAIKRAIAAASIEDIDRLLAQSEREVVAGVNICAPADYKPETLDGYCIRCDGFAECSARHMKRKRPASADAPGLVG